MTPLTKVRRMRASRTDNSRTRAAKARSKARRTQRSLKAVTA